MKLFNNFFKGREIVLILIIGLLNLGAISSLQTKKLESESTVFEFLGNLNNLEMTNSTKSSNSTAAKNFVKDLNNPSVILQNWLTINSHAFMNPSKYPVLRNSEGALEHSLKFGTEQERLNEKYSTAMRQGSKNSFSFWFKVRGGYIYYFATKEDFNVLGSILVQRVENSMRRNRHSNATMTCFDVFDNSNDKYTLCADTVEIKNTWYCSLASFLKQSLDPMCDPLSFNLEQGKTVLKKVTTPMIIIPTASKKCNEGWNYLNKGNDWECICAEGREQSPIDLPGKDSAVLSPLTPLFQYENVQAKAIESTSDGILVAGEYVKIRYDKNAIRIHHPNMGKIVALDGGVYVAEEIVFHTPSEHTINGETFDMEMQVVHYGKSKGDIAKQIVLSFLFKAKPGVYNKFLEKLDFFNLPNPTDKFRDITNDFFIPQIFYSAEDDDIPAMQPFSFYTYQGSLTNPPCTERTTHYVASDPIEISNTVIQLFKEALRVPDFLNEKGQYIQSTDGEIQNNRTTQPLNGRNVFLFDHIKFNCPQFKKQKRRIKNFGHYEKRDISVTQYVYVNGESPSGLPNSFVVDENEAKGTSSAVTGDDGQNSQRLN